MKKQSFAEEEHKIALRGNEKKETVHPHDEGNIDDGEDDDLKRAIQESMKLGSDQEWKDQLGRYTATFWFSYWLSSSMLYQLLSIVLTVESSCLRFSDFYHFDELFHTVLWCDLT